MFATNKLGKEKLSNVVGLKSFFYEKTRKGWDRKLYWGNLTDTGKQLFLNSQLDSFINDDFSTDRFWLSCFLDQYQLWDSFDVALGNMVLISNSIDEQDTSIELTDWLTTNNAFSIDVLYHMLSNLKLLKTYKSYMFNQLLEYHRECYQHGYPLIVPDYMKRDLFNHVNWNI